MPSRDVTQRVRERIRSASQLRFGERGAQFAVLAGILLVVLGVGVFIGVLDAVREVDDIAALDEPVLRALTSVRSPVATAVLTAITTVAGPVVLPVVVLVGALAWAMVVSTAVSLTVKAVVARPRPPLGTMTAAGVQSTYSFPSGHTIGTATFLLVLGYLVWVRRPRLRSLVWWALGIAAGTLVVALSRLYLGYHFLTDVVASIALAVAVLGGVVVVDRRRVRSTPRHRSGSGTAVTGSAGVDPPRRGLGDLDRRRVPPVRFERTTVGLEGLQTQRAVWTPRETATRLNAVFVQV